MPGLIGFHLPHFAGQILSLDGVFEDGFEGGFEGGLEDLPNPWLNITDVYSLEPEQLQWGLGCAHVGRDDAT